MITLFPSQRSFKATAYFGLSISFRKLYEFKAYAAQYYTITYDRILKKLVNGSIIHADETKINLQKGSGYVWVLTSMEDVVYLYRPSREADFLHTVLAGFQGVLITDFYTGYDALPCLQQKCLIHLIRDINDDLLKHPFDQELKELATLFGQLLRGIMATVDRVGLKASSLSKHKPEVKKFMDVLTVKAFESEIAGQYGKRILKYQSKLFTFLEHDGVPWNNNNAEHAIKAFSRLRDVLAGSSSKKGVNEYLTLLTVAETCEYQGLDFLEFLRSEEKDIDTFARGRRRYPRQERGGNLPKRPRQGSSPAGNDLPASHEFVGLHNDAS